MDEDPSARLKLQLNRIQADVEKLVAFMDEMRPLLDVAKAYTTASKTDKVRMLIKNGRG